MNIPSQPDLNLSPRVSVIIPAYNQARFLAGSIRSVLAQTYSDYEIIVVDDGSTDDTPLIAQQFGSAVRYIWQENQGLAGSRNTGIRNAAGEYIALLDSDDLWSPAFLQTMVALAEAHPEGDIYYCGWTAIDVDGNRLPQTGTLVFPPEKMYQAILRVNFLNCCTILMRRSTVIEAGLFDITFRRLQDWEFWLRLLRDGRKFVGIPDRLVYYRMHGSSLSTDPLGGQKAAMAIARKLFGEDNGDEEHWPDEKRRAYGGAYRYHVLSAVQRQKDWQAGAKHLANALRVDPSLAWDLDLFYELALGAQPIGFRGTARHINLEANAYELTGALQEVFSPSSPQEVFAVRNSAYGIAYQALGLAAYNLGMLRLSRRYLLSALRHNLGWASSMQVVGVLVKSLVGYRNLNRLRTMRAELRMRE